MQGEAAVGESHSLPDGQSIRVKGEGVELGEVLLDQRRIGGEGPSLAEVISDACFTGLEPAARKVIYLAFHSHNLLHVHEFSHSLQKLHNFRKHKCE